MSGRVEERVGRMERCLEETRGLCERDLLLCLVRMDKGEEQGLKDISTMSAVRFCADALGCRRVSSRPSFFFYYCSCNLAQNG